MKKLDLYIIRQFLSTLGMSLLGFVSVILIVDLIENLDFEDTDSKEKEREKQKRNGCEQYGFSNEERGL